MQTCEISGDFIQLNQFLKKENIASSGGEAKMMIESGTVKVNHMRAYEIRKKLRNGDVVEVQSVGEFMIMTH